MKIDINAPIIPFNSIGGIKLYSSLNDLEEILLGDNVKFKEIFETWLSYEIGDMIELFFLKKNGKLFKITTLDGYKGKLFEKIFVGMHEDDILKVDESFVYDDFEEVWISPKGIYIETDGETNIIRWISVFIPEIDLEIFESGEW